MPKKITISLRGIVQRIDRAKGQLSAAKTRTRSALEKKRLATKIKNLNKVRAAVTNICKSYSIHVPTA